MIPAGEPLQVHSYTLGRKHVPAVAMTSDGAFVVVWENSFQDGSLGGIFGQRFDSSGGRRGDEFRVNAHTLNQQTYPRVDLRNGGAFTIAWQSRGQDGNSEGIFARMFDAEASPQATEFQVNSTTTGRQVHPQVAIDAAGNFVIAWSGQGADPFNGIHGQRFDSLGEREGGEFRIDAPSSYFASGPALAMDSTGAFIVSWATPLRDGDGSGVFARRFDGSGEPISSTFQVNSHTIGHQISSSVVLRTGGALLVAWDGSGFVDGDAYDVFARGFDDSGPVGPQFPVNSDRKYGQGGPSIGSMGGSEFVVIWGSNGLSQCCGDGAGDGVYGRRFTGLGAPSGGDIQIGPILGEQRRPAIATDEEDQIVAVWESSRRDQPIPEGIFAQRFRLSEVNPPPPAPEIPVASRRGLVLLVLLLTGCSLVLLGRTSR